MTTILLHGFWGEPRDWNGVLHRLPLGAAVLTPDLYESGLLAPDTSIDRWAKNFLENLPTENPVQLVGYSMGARLALAAVTRAPQRFSRVLLLSGAPGLHPGVTPEARLEWEKEWAAKFLNEDWKKLTTEWSAQEVFVGDKPPEPRRESAVLREMLALSLLHWSPRLHPYTMDDVKALPATVEWAFGALDQKYVKLAKTLQESGVRGQIAIIPNAGHRLYADAPAFISDWIQGGSK